MKPQEEEEPWSIMEIAGHVCIRCGCTMAEFWDLTPWETTALAVGYEALRRDDHKREAWFTAHRMWASGMLKPGTSIRKLIENLNSPVEKPRETIEIRTAEDMARWESERAKYLEAKDEDDGQSTDDAGDL